MALLLCSECNGQVSDKVENCPHCGCPVEFIVHENVTPLTTTAGSELNLLRQDKLYGKCPRCNTDTTFEVLSIADLLKVLNGLKKEGGYKTGFISSLVAYVSNLLKGHSLPFSYTCTNCNQHYYVCRKCMKPTVLRVGSKASYCDYCK